MDITAVLAFIVEKGASNLHLSAGLPPNDKGRWGYHAGQFARLGSCRGAGAGLRHHE